MFFGPDLKINPEWYNDCPFHTLDCNVNLLELAHEKSVNPINRF
jgi:hypothetical protein